MHFCPSCGQACDCCGDIEDHDTGEQYTDECGCCDGWEECDDEDDIRHSLDDEREAFEEREERRRLG